MILKNQILYRPNKKAIVWDAFFNKDNKRKPLVIFCHGYKGFKDWGAWDLVAQEFAKANLFFMKFNFSHNGGTIEIPIDFPDLEAFAENNYSKELEDLDNVLNFLTSNHNLHNKEIDFTNISLIGHSRGGGISIIKASEDARITKLITWASVSSFGKRTSTTGDLIQWKKEGVKYVLNGRTKQQMPHNYQFYEDFINNEKRLDIESAIKKIIIPTLIIHGTDDPSISFSEAENLYAWNKNAYLYPIENANHVFNSKHPWDEQQLPEALNQVIMKSIAFI
jgi:pimeloyl-ACP methyl ester carboxylesterase